MLADCTPSLVATVLNRTVCNANLYLMQKGVTGVIFAGIWNNNILGARGSSTWPKHRDLSLCSGTSDTRVV